MSSASSNLNSQDLIWIEKWMTGHSIFVLFGVLFSSISQSHWWLFGSSLFSFLLFFFRQYRYRQTISFTFEAANLVSTFRLLALLFLFGFYFLLDFRQIAILSISILALDGLDGYFARKYNTASHFGAYLDMETDALFVMALTFLIAYLNLMGWWVIGLGLLRYLYFLLIRWWKPPEREERRSFIARFIAVFLMGSLVSCFVLSKQWYQPILIFSSVLVAYSFGRDFLFILLHARKTKTA